MTCADPAGSIFAALYRKTLPVPRRVLLTIPADRRFSRKLDWTGLWDRVLATISRDPIGERCVESMTCAIHPAQRYFRGLWVAAQRYCGPLLSDRSVVCVDGTLAGAVLVAVIAPWLAPKSQTPIMMTTMVPSDSSPMASVFSQSH